jgi:hypothetical protein
LKTLFPPKKRMAVWYELHKSNIHGWAAIAEPLIDERVMLRCINSGVMTIKLGHQTNGNVLDMVR